MNSKDIAFVIMVGYGFALLASAALGAFIFWLLS